MRSNFGDSLLNRFLDPSQGYAYGVNVTSIKYGDTELLNFLPGHDAYVGEFDSGTTSAPPPPRPRPPAPSLTVSIPPPATARTRPPSIPRVRAQLEERVRGGRKEWS